MNTNLIPLTLAGFLLFLVIAVNWNIISSTTEDETTFSSCRADANVCKTIYSTFGSSDSIELLVQNKRIKESGIPSLNILLSGQALTKLNQKWRLAMAEKRPILLLSNEDWVSATLEARDGESVLRSKAFLRLAGREATYFSDPRRRSLEIRQADGPKLFGMNSFSILRPETRGYDRETLLYFTLGKLGIPTPRLFPLDVRINDRSIGVMLIEQEIGDELMQWHGRRPGAIVGLDDTQYWAQRHLNFNRSDADFETLNRLGVTDHYALNDYPVVLIGAYPKSAPGARIETQRRAQRLFRDFLEQRIPANEVFDIDLLAKWFVTANVFEASYGLKPHNWRYYLNPITDVLEPLAYNNFASSEVIQGIATNDIIDDLMTDEQFQNSIENTLELLRRLFASGKFKEDVVALRRLWAAQLDNVESKSWSTNALLENLNRFESAYEARSNLVPSIQASLPHAARKAAKRFLDTGVSVHSHITAFIFVSRSGVRLTVKNLMNEEVAIERIYFHSAEKDSTIVRNVVLGTEADDVGASHLYSMQIETENIDNLDSIAIEYRFDGEVYEQNAIIQYSNRKRRLISKFPSDLSRISNKIVVHEDLKMVIIKEGVITISDTIELPRYWTLVLQPGVRLNLMSGGLIKVRGALYSLGMRQKPVTIQIESSLGRDEIETWGGILIEQGFKKSILRYTNIQGNGVSKSDWKDDFYGLTGCITVYKSAIEISESRFDALQCSDSLNVFRSEYKIENTSFFMAHGNGLGLESSRGSILGTRFEGANRNGLRLEASFAQLADSSFFGINDTAIRVNRRSILDASQLSIESSNTAISSLDRSQTTVSGGVFSDILNVVLNTAEKGDGAGKSSIDCIDCTFQNIITIATTDANSDIRLNGRAVSQNGHAELN